MSSNADIPNDRKMPGFREAHRDPDGEITEYHGDFVGLSELQNPAPDGAYPMRRFLSDVSMSMQDLAYEPKLDFGGIVVMPKDAHEGLPSHIIAAGSNGEHLAECQMISGNVKSGYAPSGTAETYARSDRIGGLDHDNFRVVSVVLQDWDKGLQELEQANPDDRIHAVLRSYEGKITIPRQRRSKRMSANILAKLRK